MSTQTKAHYPEDQPLTENAEFMSWIAELEAILHAWGEQHGGDPYGLPLHQTTGLECWHASFEDGMTPEEAFKSDQSYWEE